MKPIESCISASNTPASPISASLSFFHNSYEHPHNYAFEPPAGAPWENYEATSQNVSIFDGRKQLPTASLDIEGYSLWEANTSVKDFNDRDAIISVYYPEVTELVRAATGATQAHVFDHLVRKRDTRRELDFGRTGQGMAVSANGRVHNDYTEQSGRKRMRMVCERLGLPSANGRYAIVNIWRSIKAPVLDTPLAVCDARSVHTADLISAEVRYPQRIGEIYLLKHASHQRWAYFSAMGRHEALIFKQYDTQSDGIARFTPHAAFQHPLAPPDATPRESIEARCLIIYE